MAVKILIVDDDADLRSSLAAVLRPLFKVLEASNGAEALDVLKKERPRLTLLDVSMPGMSGLEVLAAAKASDPALIVVMLTSQQDIEIAAKALNLGATEYVTKPFDADYIRAEVSRLTGAPDEPSNDKPWRVVP
jgi:DNA-binding NtrC family response regulator